MLTLDDGCTIIIRVKQSSQTQGYVGGTTENMYHTCPTTTPGRRLTAFVGTEKKPRRFRDWVLFLSDDNGSGKVGRMSLYGMPLEDLIETKKVKVTCFGDMPITDFAVDPVTQDITLSIAGSIYSLSASNIQAVLSGSASTTLTPTKLEVFVLSDFAQGLERTIVPSLKHYTTFDATPTLSLSTVR